MGRLFSCTSCFTVPLPGKFSSINDQVIDLSATLQAAKLLSKLAVEAALSGPSPTPPHPCTALPSGGALSTATALSPPGTQPALHFPISWPSSSIPPPCIKLPGTNDSSSLSIQGALCTYLSPGPGCTPMLQFPYWVITLRTRDLSYFSITLPLDTPQRQGPPLSCLSLSPQPHRELLT